MQTEHGAPTPLGYRPGKAAEMIGCTERSIYRYLRDKKLSAKRVGGMTLVTAESLQAFIANSPDWKPHADPAAATAA